MQCSGRQGVAIGTALLVAASGCIVSGGVEFSVVDSGSQTGFHDDEFTVRVVESEDEWQGFWAEHRRSTSEPGSPPDVDFEERFVVGLFLGQRPSSGYEVNVTDVRVEDDGYVGDYATVVPGDRCAVLTVITWPFVVVSVERRGGVDVTVETQHVDERVLEC